MPDREGQHSGVVATPLGKTVPPVPNHCMVLGITPSVSAPRWSSVTKTTKFGWDPGGGGGGGGGGGVPVSTTSSGRLEVELRDLKPVPSPLAPASSNVTAPGPVTRGVTSSSTHRPELT